MQDGPRAGWYDDPLKAATLRWWDGEAWTGHTLTPATPAVEPSAAPTGPPPHPEPNLVAAAPPNAPAGEPSSAPPAPDKTDDPAPPPPSQPAPTDGLVPDDQPSPNDGLALNDQPSPTDGLAPKDELASDDQPAPGEQRPARPVRHLVLASMAAVAAISGLVVLATRPWAPTELADLDADEQQVVEVAARTNDEIAGMVDNGDADSARDALTEAADLVCQVARDNGSAADLPFVLELTWNAERETLSPVITDPTAFVAFADPAIEWRCPELATPAPEPTE